MSANMLTEQNVVLESTDSSDTMPIGFITTDDGHTLLAMGGKDFNVICNNYNKYFIYKITNMYNVFSLEYEDGTLKIMATPIALMPQNNMVSPTLVKTIDGNFILHSVSI